MKNNYFLSFICLLFFAGSLSAQIYVDQGASGSNDGTSWANAYTDLSDAIAASSPGDQLWVAAGTYKPGGAAPSIDTFFRMQHDLELYGGFNGTESMLDERDWVANVTNLSGDYNDDDSDADITLNRTDNAKHVMWLTDTITSASIIDGFTVRNGNTEGADGSGNDRRGGGILTYGNPTIRNCTFTQNSGHFGGGLYPRGTDAIVIENCNFTNNVASWGGAGIYINSVAADITNCTFSENSATTLRGGGVYSNGVVINVTDCVFTNNSAASSSAGAMHLTNGSDDPPIVANVTSCTFSGNSATFGGAVACYQGTLTTNITDCEFTENESVNVGGALTNAFGAITNVTNCAFSENESMGSGGAIYSQNDENVITISNTDIVSNTAEFGGGINMSGDNEAFVGLPLPTLNLDKVTLVANIAVNQGGGINISNANGNFTNILLDLNLVTEADGIGGGISLNTSDTINATFNVINSTIVNNLAFIGAGISHWKPGTEATSVLTVQNTIFDNPFGNNYDIEDGDPVFVSNGGNLSSDATMTAELIGTNDLNEEDPLFVDPEDNNYYLQNTSPCIDSGIAAGAPDTDIEGLPRVNAPDMGAYENQQISSVRDLNKYFGQLNVFPNPVQDELSYSFESVWKGRLEVRISDQSGKVLLDQLFDKGEHTVLRQIDVRQLPQGMYNLSVSNGRLVKTIGFVKL